MNGDIDPLAEIKASFFDECDDLLEALHDGLQAFADKSADAETVNVIFRAVHSIKGGAGAFGFETLVRFAHFFETTLEELRAGRLEASTDTIRVLFTATDHLSDLIRSARDDQPVATAMTVRFEGMLKELAKLPADGGSTHSSQRTEPNQNDCMNIGKVERRSASTPKTKSAIRVDNERIERLASLVSELMINQAMLTQSLEGAGLVPYSDVMKGLEEFKRLSHDIQDSVLKIRAHPVKTLFQRMSRIVRETAVASGKDIQFRTTGEATEVDKAVIERLVDPLTHILRNAVDHGIETPEERCAASKPAQGRVTLSATHRAGRLMIEASDDGAGINRAKVLHMAAINGLIAPELSLSDVEADALLFEPGFSTVSTVSDLSGRGVGMDVARTAIKSIGGRISVRSKPGEGTTLSISLPLTLAVLDGMVVDVAGETLIIPLNIVLKALRIRGEDIQSICPDQDVVQVFGDPVPILDLGATLGFRQRSIFSEESVVVLIVRANGKKAALLIDEIKDQGQVVIKGLDPHCFPAPGIVGATILGDGQIAFIFDPSELDDNNRMPAKALASPLVGVFA